MNPATLTLVVQALAMAIKIAKSPEIAAIAAAGKAYIAQLFTSGLITQVEQDATFAYVDGVAKAAAAGIRPDHWQVQPDPVS